jgi:hypothetical protein
MSQAITTYRVADERGIIAFVTDTELVGRLSRAGLRVTAVTRSI